MDDKMSATTSAYKKKKFTAMRVASDAPERQYKCNKCSEYFQYWWDVMNHYSTHSGNQLKCPVCFKNVGNKPTLKLHMLTHTGERPFECDKCGSKFRQKSHLNVHLKSRSNCEEASKYTFQEQYIPPYVCNLCSNSFHSLNNTRRHILDNHSDENCGICDKQITEKCVQERHEIHVLKPYECEVCKKRFSFLQFLKKHVMGHQNHKFSDKPTIHTDVNDRGYWNKCEICDKTFKQHGNLRRHMRIHTGEKPFQCEFCSKRFCQSNSLKVHIRTHTGEKPYKCKDCGSCFSEPKGVRIHKCSADAKNNPMIVYLCKDCNLPIDNLNNHRCMLSPPEVSTVKYFLTAN